MSEYSLSPLAELDLEDIAAYSVNMWGVEQAVHYQDAMFACFDRIALNPRLGRRCDSIRPGLRRIEEGKHVIFYKPVKSGVFISRILHQGMIPARHQVPED